MLRLGSHYQRLQLEDVNLSCALERDQGQPCKLHRAPSRSGCHMHRAQSVPKAAVITWRDNIGLDCSSVTKLQESIHRLDRKLQVLYYVVTKLGAAMLSVPETWAIFRCVAYASDYCLHI